MFRVVKVNVMTGKEKDYGVGYSDEDVKAIVKGYRFNGCFYVRNGSRWYYVVREC